MTSPVLPPDEVARLTDLRYGDPEARLQFYLRVRALRAAGWTLASVAEPLGVDRRTVRIWAEAAGNPTDLPSVPLPRRDLPPRVKLMRPDVPAGEVEELLRLSLSARNVRGWTPAHAQSRLDAEALDDLLACYVSRGVPVKRLSRHMGVTYRAVAARLERMEARGADTVAA